jgi:hypothetical protein
MSDEKAKIVQALRAWIRQRPGLDWRNYTAESYRSDARRIGQQLRDAETLLSAVAGRQYVGAEYLIDAFRRAFMGRLSWDGAKLAYVEGQYWPTEYRAAACSVLAQAIWSADCEGAPGMSREDRLRYWRRELGRGVVARWF